MGRWSHYDTDEERLPEGMTRIGYDADEQTYTYRDERGDIWESAPGNRYGPMTRISQYSGPGDTGPDNSPAPPPPYEEAMPKVSWRHELMPLFNWFFILGLFLIGVYFLMASTVGKAPGLPAVQCGDGFGAHRVQSGDTCWAIANSKGVSLQALQSANEAMECEKLQVGQTLCVPGL